MKIAKAVAWMRRRAENVVAGLLGLMFVAFIIQIVFRYFFNFPIGWTSELSVIAWLYMVLIGSAFWLKENEEVRFDLVSSKLGPLGRRVLASWHRLTDLNDPRSRRIDVDREEHAGAVGTRGP